MKLKAFVILLFLGLFVFWFIGWKSVRYDKTDSEIGQKVIFTVPMIITTNIPELMSGSMVAEKYGSMLWTAVSWENSKHNFPMVQVEEVKCNQAFIIVDVFYRETHGFLMRGFVGRGLKYYVLSFSNKQKTITPEGIYKAYARDVNSFSYDYRGMPIISRCGPEN